MSDVAETLTHVQLEILPAVLTQSWHQSQAMPQVQAQWTVYLNQICLEAVMPWLREEQPQITLDGNRADLPSLWSLVNGTPLKLDTKRLVLIPDRSLDTSELRVPQEWVDIPAWVGDYFLAVQVNPDDGTLQVWGYATHEQMKTLACYDPSDRTYCLDATAVTQDLSVLWVVQQLYPDEPTQVAVEALSAVPEVQATNLLQRLANPAIETPRLEIPFTLWGALVSQPAWRQQLFHQRQGDTTAAVSQVVTNLSQWMQRGFESGWQALESLLSPDELAFSFRQVAETTEAVVRRVKLLRMVDQPILLIVWVEVEPDSRVGIRVQLRSPDRHQLLPETLTLNLLAPSGQVIQTVSARSQDNAIQLQRFRVSSGTPFTLHIELADHVITEDFVA